MQLSFIKSNWLRQYPFKANCGLLDNNGNAVPKDIVVALRLTCVPSDLDIYIDRIYTASGVVNISFSGSNGPLGYATSAITDANQNILIKSYAGGIIGNVTVGNPDSTQPVQTFTFNNVNGLIEPTTVLAVPTPTIKDLKIKGSKLVGRINIFSNSLNIAASTTLNISVISPAEIESRKDLSSKYLTCENQIIGGINGVTPNKNNNIDIYTIDPLEISINEVDGIAQLYLSTPDITLDQLCKLINSPPADLTDTPHEDIDEITVPEWKSWPQYN